MILRLLLFEECNRACEGCCNKQFDLDNLPVEKDFSTYEMIILTGGEPMLRPKIVLEAIRKIRNQSKAKIILYTAYLNPYNSLTYQVLAELDGVTLSLHEQSDINNFQTLQVVIKPAMKDWDFSKRLNVFKEVDLTNIDTSGWVVKKDVEWIENCPLPENEVFMRY